MIEARCASITGMIRHYAEPEGRCDLRSLAKQPPLKADYTVELGGRKADRATKELGAIEVEAATGELNVVEGDCATGELGVSKRAAVEDSAGEVRVKAVKAPPTSRSKSSVRVIGWEPEARGADGGPDHPAQIREHPVVVTSSQDRATCNRTLTLS